MAKCTIICEFRDGSLHPVGQSMSRVKADYLATCADKSLHQVTIQPKRNSKTRAQLGYWYAVVIPTIVDALKAAGYDTLGELAFGVELQTNPITVDELLKGLYAMHLGTDKTLLKRRMTDEQMSGLIEHSCRWAAQNLGAVVPAADGEIEWQQTSTK